MSDLEVQSEPKPAMYALNIDPLTVTTAQLAALMMAFQFAVPEDAYNGFPVNLKFLFQKVQ